MSQFDGSHPLTSGVDLSVAYGTPGSDVNQAIDEATPFTLYGFVIKSYDTPPVVTSDWLKRCLWLKQPGAGDAPNEVYYYDDDLGSWEHFRGILGITIDDGSITLAKLSTNDGLGNIVTAGQVIRRNAGNTAFEWVSPSNLFSAGSLAPSVLTSGVALPDYILVTNGSGVFTSTLVSDVVESLFISPFVPLSTLYRDITGSAGQALFVKSDDSLELAWVEDKLRTAKTPLDKLLIPTGNALKLMQVTAAGTGIQFVDLPSAVSVSSAVVKYSVSQGTAAQNVTTSATAPVTVQLNTKVETAAIVTVASNQMTLGAGTYELTATVPLVDTGTGSNTAGQLILYDVTGAASVAVAVFFFSAAADGTVATLNHVFTIGSSTVYEIRVATAANSASLYLGSPANIAGFGETYAQVRINKIA